MRKFKLLGVCLFLILCLNQWISAQYLTKTKFDWSKIEKLVPDTIKTRYISRLIGNEFADDKYLADTSNYTSREYFNKQLSKFHLVDINVDNLMDIIYEGNHVKEGEDLVFYINTGDSLKIALKVFGYVEKMTFKNNKLVSMQCVIVSCCCMYGFYRDYYSFTKPNHQYTKIANVKNPLNSMYFSNLLNCKRIAIEALEYFVLPLNDDLNEDFIAPRSFYLTTNPKPLVNKDYPGIVDCSYGMIDNFNQVALFEKDSKGTILSKYISKDGKSYSFIKINNKMSHQSIIPVRDCYIYGWTETENLE